MASSDDHLAEIKAFFKQNVPFNALLNIEVVELEPGHALVRMPFRDDLIGDGARPALHGGSVAALIDAAAGAAALSATAPGNRVSTVDLRIDYLCPAPLEDLLASARVLRMGRRVAVVNVVVTLAAAAGESPVAEGRGVFSIKHEPST